MNKDKLRSVKINENELKKFYNLKNLIRYNPRSKISNESVAEHSYFVALFALLLSQTLEMSDGEILNCVTKALIHDLPEIDLSDIPHNVKREYPVLSSVIAAAEKEWYKKNIPQINTCTNEVEEDIVEMADIYSVIQYCLYEKELGNSSFDDIKKISENRLNSIINKY